MATLYLVRHGQASFAAENYDRLSELGRRQSVWLGEYFAERGIVFARAVCGTLERQRQTARAILDTMGSTLTAAEHRGWNEYSGEALYKAYLGDEWAQARAIGDVRAVYRTIKAALAAWSEDKLQGPLPETWSGFGERVAAAMRSACTGLPHDVNVLAATSGGAIGRGIADLLLAPARTAIELNLQFRNSGFCEVYFGPRSMRLVSFNCVPHLERAATGATQLPTRNLAILTLSPKGIETSGRQAEESACWRFRKADSWRRSSPPRSKAGSE